MEKVTISGSLQIQPRTQTGASATSHCEIFIDFFGCVEIDDTKKMRVTEMNFGHLGGGSILTIMSHKILVGTHSVGA